MNNTKITIIVPIYNAADKISRCIDSLVNQTLREIEIICVDDCSTDNSADVIRDFEKQDSRIKVIRNDVNLGTFETRKRGIMAAQGQYIMFADNDDWYDLNACEELYDYITQQKVDILLYRARAVEPDGVAATLEKKNWDNKFNIVEETIISDHCHKIKNRMTWLWNRIVKAEIYKEAFANSENVRLTFVEDAYSCWLIHYFAKSYTTLNKAYYNYDYISGTSNSEFFTYEQFCGKCDELLKLVELLHAFFEKQGTLEDNKWALDYETNRGLDVCCYYWLERVKTEDSYSILQYINQAYGEENVIKRIHEKTTIMLSDNHALSKETKKMRKRIKKLNNSRAMKIGKAITFVPRKIKSSIH